MSRMETTSIFSDGLMSDLHPINTPKSVLTDCLNGTYITYNGNEFILQNDMGNYKLKNCKLPTNFIPVGIKGYADILYIVSYNPLTRMVEIGSYPAPQSIFVVEDNQEVSSEKNLVPFDLKLNSNLYYRYPIIINEQKHPLFIFTNGEDSETYKLYPGDEFKLESLDQDPDFIYQHLNFYVIDEDNKLYDLDDNDIYNYTGPTNDGFRKVFWETPGWLAAQYDLYTPNKFTLNLRSLNVPDFLITKETATLSEQSDLIFDSSLEEISEGNNQFKVSMDLSAQCIITDKLFQQKLRENFVEEKKPDEIFEHLFIRFLINTKSDTYGIFKGMMDRNGNEIQYTDASSYNQRYKDPNLQCVDIQCQNHNYQDDIFTAFVNCYAVWFFDRLDIPLNAYPYIAEITAFPVIRYNGSELEFTQFSNTLSFPLNTLKDSSNIQIADTVYKWSVDDNSCTLSFNISGPFINAQNITGEYEIYRLNLFQGKKGTFDNSKTGISKYYNAEFKEPDVLINNDDPEDWEHALLMLKGTIPNLVLFGQNTININYSESNILSIGGKDYKFQAEDGIYLIKFILKQNEEILPILNDTKILIPSAVFNDYFGTIDNYNTLTGDSWLNKYLSYVPDIDLSGFNMILKEDPNVNEAIMYRWDDDPSNTPYIPFSQITWNDLKNSSLNNIDLPLSFEQKLWIIFYKKYPNFIKYTINYTNDINNKSKVESVTFEQTIYKESTLAKNLRLIVDYTQLFIFDGIPKATLLSGSLWNNKTEYKVQLGNSNSQFQITVDDQNAITMNGDTITLQVTMPNIDAPEPGEPCYPIMDNLQKNTYLNFRASDKTYEGPFRYDVWYWTGTIRGDSARISMALEDVTNSTQQVEQTSKLDIETESNLVKFTFNNFKNLKFTQGLTFYHTSAEASYMGWYIDEAIYTSFDRSNIGEAAADNNNKFCAHTTKKNSKAKYTGHSKTNYFCVWNDLERYHKRIIVLNFSAINTSLYNRQGIDYLPGAIMALCCVKYTPYSSPTRQYYLQIQNLSSSFEESFEFIINSLILNLTVSDYKTDDHTWQIDDSVYNLFKVTTLQKINSIHSTVPSKHINANLSNLFKEINAQLNSFLNITANPYTTLAEKYQNPEFLQVTRDWKEMKQYCEKKYFEKKIPYEIKFLQDTAYTFDDAKDAHVNTFSCQFDESIEDNPSAYETYFLNPSLVQKENTLKLFKWLFGEDPINYNKWRFVQDDLDFNRSIKFRCRDNVDRHNYTGEMFYYYEVQPNDIK